MGASFFLLGQGSLRLQQNFLEAHSIEMFS